MTLLHQADELLLGFTRALRGAGVRVTHDRAVGFLQAASILGVDHRVQTYRAGRATLCSSPDDLERFDQVFDAWFGGHEGLPRAVPRPASAPAASVLPIDEAETGSPEADSELIQAAVSTTELLRHRDVATLTPREKALLDALLGALRFRPPMRRALRRTPYRRGEVDMHRTLRSTLRQLGEPAPIQRQRRGNQRRRMIFLIDVSASMRPYVDALLRVTHRMSATGVETFTLGTRLTRITAAMRTRDAERALVRAGDEIADWAGGTRLGETLKAFNDRWGARGMARGAVVVVFSDGWEKGDAAELGEQMRRLHLLAHRVIWVNPHRGKQGYQPLQQGIVAALPYVDDFVAGHSLRSFERLLEVIANA